MILFYCVLSDGFLFLDGDPSFDRCIDLIHAREQFFEDREIISDDHTGFLVLEDLFDRKVEEFGEILEMIVLDSDFEHLVVDDILVIETEFFEIMSGPVVDHPESFRDLIKFRVAVTIQRFISQHEFHHVTQLSSIDL